MVVVLGFSKGRGFDLPLPSFLQPPNLLLRGLSRYAPIFLCSNVLLLDLYVNGR